METFYGGVKMTMESSPPKHASGGVAVVEPAARSLPRSGDRVRIEKGPLAGAEAVLLQTGTRSIVSVKFLERSLAVEFDSSWVTLLV
jgi:hypothetical protein